MNLHLGKPQKLYLALSLFFVSNVLIAEFIGVKVFSLEDSFGIKHVNWKILDFTLSFQLTAGVLLWPVVFIFTDIINEYYGRKGVKRISYYATLAISYSFLAVSLAMWLAPADWWVIQDIGNDKINMQHAFTKIFGQGLWIIIGSIIAFLVGQMLDVYIFHYIKKATGEKYLWLRANGSTFFSQIIDSFLVLFIAFYIGSNWSIKQVLAVGVMNMIFKVSASIVLTPLLYTVHNIIEKYLGHDVAKELKNDASK